MYITQDIKTVDKTITSLAAAYKSRVTPSNLGIIQQKILKPNRKLSLAENCGIIGFSYEYVNKNFSKRIEQLKNVQLPKGIFKSLYKHKIEESIKKFELSASLGTVEFSEKSKELYGYPQKKLINKAFDILQLEPSPEGETMSVQEAKRKLKSKLDVLKVPWKIKTKKLINYANISPAKNVITLSSNHTFSEKTINRLAVHEIGTHGVRYMNARLQPLRILKNFPKYLGTEEGLAAFNEEINGYLNNDTLRRYAGRVVAIEYAQTHNLIETFQFLEKYFSKSNAFSIAMRIKRGLANSESTGAFTKDHLYLKGFFEIKQYIKKNPLRYLYYGKVGTEYIKLLKKIEPELTPIKYYPPLITSFDRKSKLLN